jgi:hypothetical protein
MDNLPEADVPPTGLGMASLVLGVIGLLLFFFPILGLPLGACGGFFGLIGIVTTAGFGKGGSLRWTLAGFATSVLAVLVNLAILYAPAGYLPQREVPKLWQSVSDTPYVPPPAPAPW